MGIHRTVCRRRAALRNLLALFGAVLLLGLGCAQAGPSSKAKNSGEVPPTKNPDKDSPSPETDSPETKSPAVPPKTESPGPTPPVLTPSDRRACKQDSDCELLPPRPCACPPCGDVWREVLNAEAADDLRQRWAARRCTQPECTECTGRYLGTLAVCVDSQCAVR